MGFRQTVMAVTVAALAALAAPPTAGAQSCPGGAATPAAVVCELNATRAAHGLAPLTARRSLATAARRHAADMVERRYFAHESPEGEGPGQRARRAGYMDHAERWRIGEVLIWSRGAELTAAAAVQAWLGSPGHRAVILRAGYRDAGVGSPRRAPGSPGARPASTIAVVTGRRSYRPSAPYGAARP